jgi:hypothetical protein
MFLFCWNLFLRMEGCERRGLIFMLFRPIREHTRLSAAVGAQNLLERFFGELLSEVG